MFGQTELGAVFPQGKTQLAHQRIQTAKIVEGMGEFLLRQLAAGNAMQGNQTSVTYRTNASNRGREMGHEDAQRFSEKTERGFRFATL